ncbi:MAG TPA: hypothetical protein VEK57_14585 [Thermoanaerobaculia bacterium]|nr:hypothetical protein [Thermoanaerobaculia bacterium]
MIEGFEPNAPVIVNLVNPKEKFFGVLRALSPAGITMKSVNLDSFDDWVREIARGEEASIGMVTMFVPLFRVERIFLDEPAGAVKSYSQRFWEVVGRNVLEYLGLPPDSNRADANADRSV